MVSIKDIALAANVTPGTVSRVLNGRAKDGRISEATSARVRAAAEALGYKPNRLARALSMGTTMQVALWVPNLAEPYYGEMVHCVNTSLRAAGYDMLVSDAPTGGTWRSHLDGLATLPVDGILACDSPVYAEAYLSGLGAEAKPLVSFGSNVTAVETVDVVHLDIYPGALEALRHLASAAPGPVAYVVPADSANLTDDRYRAYLAFCHNEGMDELVITLPGYTPRAAHSALASYLARNAAPQAICCFNDDVAFGVHRAVLEAGLRMPEDVALVGHNGIRDCDYLFPRLSTVQHPLEHLCRLAWELLHDRMQHPVGAAQRRLLLPELVVAASSQRNGHAL